ncbi:SWI/SNF-related matrix-associated actin-dependent regulator of chromatin subfamily A-like protein 1 [Neocloeon triangulifer]|uniref:SWI/SNF-related matrix-associated actin-dependent regulator of chromatin subfamily A-like protein 1 n=1 Tax=Neocloeon triangulifer TaxID=2078957 RepID=UPI00286EF2A3|nr:SWI/SNF-related matrix-associated actin-dependent regulator of chromatin subfamily A-like protein 1 [Neocloeon triangulifer]
MAVFNEINVVADHRAASADRGKSEEGPGKKSGCCFKTTTKTNPCTPAPATSSTETCSKCISLIFLRQRGKEAPGRQCKVAQISRAAAGNASAPKKFKQDDRSNSALFRTFGSEVKLDSSNNGTCKITSRLRFTVNIGYNQQTIEVFKKIPSKQYDMKSKCWNFLLKDHDTLIQSMKTITPPVFVTPIPSKLIKLLMLTERSVEEIDLSRIDPVCWEALMPFQIEGVKFCISKGGRALLADDMGLGKTIQALAVASYYKADWPLLIACPSSVRFSWAESFRMWLPSVPWHELVVMTSGKEFISDAKILVVSYELLSRHKEALEKMKFGVIILDESHSLKNFTTKRTKAVNPLVKKAKRVLLLSGTPALSKPIELYPQLCIICPGAMMSIDEYGVRYCNAVRRPYGMDYGGACNMDELNIILQECFMIRRLKQNVLTQLPGKFRQSIVLPASSICTEKKELQFAKEALSSVSSGSAKHGALLSYYHETSYVKTKAICDYIMELLEADKKFICFAHHTVVLDAICDRLIRNKCRYIRIDGVTSPATRQELCQTFQEDVICKVAVLSITAANAGITLTAAHMVVFAELFWNPGIMLQAEDRVHRIGQQNTVVVQYLVAKNTSDDHMWNLLQKKLRVLNRAGLNQDNMTATTSTRVLEDEKHKITQFLTKSQAVSEENKIAEEDLLLDELDWDAIDAESAQHQ